MKTEMTQTMRSALVDCSKFPRGRYHWKPATMRKALALGLVEPVQDDRPGYGMAYALTDAGREAIAD